MATMMMIWISTAFLSFVVFAVASVQPEHDEQTFLDKYGFRGAAIGIFWPLGVAIFLTALPMMMIVVIMLMLGKIVPPLVAGFAEPIEACLIARRARLEAPRTRIPY